MRASALDGIKELPLFRECKRRMGRGCVEGCHKSNRKATFWERKQTSGQWRQPYSTYWAKTLTLGRTEDKKGVQRKAGCKCMRFAFCVCGTISPSICAPLLIADYIITNFIDCYVQDEGFFNSLWLMLQDCWVLSLCVCVLTDGTWHLRLLQKKENTKEYKLP